MFKDWLIKKLEEENLKQADLARYTGITTGAISNYINGTIPKNDELKKIAKVFKMNPTRIFEIAGILPEENTHDQLTRDAIYIFEKLDKEEKERAIRHLRLCLKIQEEIKKKK